MSKPTQVQRVAAILTALVESLRHGNPEATEDFLGWTPTATAIEGWIPKLRRAKGFSPAGEVGIGEVTHLLGHMIIRHYGQDAASKISEACRQIREITG